MISILHTFVKFWFIFLLYFLPFHSYNDSAMFRCSYTNAASFRKVKLKKYYNPTDITMQIQDVYTNLIRKVGFSIKSEVGNAPTLLNAGKTTNFIYKIDGLNCEQAKEINAIETRTKIQDRMEKIREYGGKISYADMSHKGFKRNLIMVDSSMPEILGNMLLYFYAEDIKDCNAVVVAVSHDCFKSLTIENLDQMLIRGENKSKVIVDIKGMFNKKEIESLGYNYWRL